MLKKRGLWAKLSFDNLPTDIAAIFRSATTSFYSSTELLNILLKIFYGIFKIIILMRMFRQQGGRQAWHCNDGFSQLNPQAGKAAALISWFKIDPFDADV